MDINEICVDKSLPLKEVMKIIDVTGYGIAFVTTQNRKLLGVITDSDIRRALLKGITLEEKVESIMNQTPITVTEEDLKQKIISFEKIPLYGMTQIPVLDKDKKIIDVVFVSKKEVIGHMMNGQTRKVKNILVVGGAGFLGSVLCEKLLQKGYHVRILDNLTYGDDGIKIIYPNKELEFMYGDIRKLRTLVKAIKDMDAVIHLAAIVGDSASDLNPEETIESNYLASKMLAEVCKYSQINRFIFASTCSVYGASEHGKMLTEESKLNPISLYAKMKLKSEQGILEIEDENFSPTIFRMATLYGDSYRMRFDLVVNTMTIHALKDNKITVFGGNQWRALCSVEDAAEAYIRCLETPINVVKGQIFNVVTDNLTIIDIAKIVHQHIPNSELIVKEDMKDIRDYRVSDDKIKNKISFTGRHTIKEGVGDIMYTFYKGKYDNYPNKKYMNVDFLKEKENE